MPATLSLRWLPGRGIADDVRARIPHYKDDWVQGCNWGLRVFAPATYIFFASALPALAFGQQLAINTEGTLTVVHVLVATALSGLVQSILGGQPLLIIGVAEPIVLIYGFCYSFAKATPGLGTDLFLAWAGWVCIWTSIMCLILALAGTCSGIDKFTRFSGELFGALIAILFFQVGIKGIVNEFYPAESTGSSAAAADPALISADSTYLTLINGLWGLFLGCGVLLTCLKVLRARKWLLGRTWLRGLIADYGVPLLIVVWSAVSFAVRPAAGVPRRVATPNTWEVNDNWTVASRLSEVPSQYIAAALLPALIITVLFYFDHNVSSQMAQQPEFNLVKPPAYHYDFALLAGLTLICGLLGIPPVNGVLPQAPMHTRSLAHIHKRRLSANHQQVSSATSTQAVPCAAAASNSVVLPTSAADGAQAQGTSPFANGCSRPNGKVQHWQSSRAGAACDAAVLALPVSSSAGLLAALVQAAAAGQQDHLSRTSCELRHRSSQAYRSPERPSVLLTPQQQAAGKHEKEQHYYAQKKAALAGDAAAVPQQQQSSCRSGLKEAGSQVALNTLPDSAVDAAVVGGLEDGSGDAGSALEGHCLKLEVREQRVTNLLQSLLIAVCLGITPAIQLIPTAVLWGYFIFMAVESLTGSQLWERLLLLLTDPKKRVEVMQREHAAYLQLVPYRVVVRYTLLQLVYLLGVWALTTWAGIAGVAFPLPIMALVPLRQYVLPRLFKRQHLAELDAASYEQAPPIQDKQQATQELYAVGAISEPPAPALPVTGDSAAPGVAGEDESEVLSQEFVGYRVKHHITAEELEHHRSH